MELKTFKSDFVLLLTASIWGMAFVAQRMGMDHVGPYTFNGIRFALGGLSLLPFVMLTRKRNTRKKNNSLKAVSGGSLASGGILAGCVLFAGASFQQVGLVYTTAGKAGFITGLYVVIVPVLGILWKQRVGAGTWAGAVMAAAGLYLLSVTEAMTISFGDFLELLGAFCFALHVIIIGRLSPRINTAYLSIIQCGVCSVFSLGAALVLEEISLAGVRGAALPIFYGGVFSVGIAYSLQIYGQKTGHPAHAAILLSLESVVAALGGWAILGEVLSPRGIVGCALMMTGMLISQLYTYLLSGRPIAETAPGKAG